MGMILIGICQLFLWMFVIPAIAGTFFYNPYKGVGRIVFFWISGQFFLWAVFFLISVPLILREASLSVAVYGYCAAVAFILAAAAVRGVVCRIGFGIGIGVGGKNMPMHLVHGNHVKKKVTPQKVYRILFLLLLFLQLVMTVVLAYRDGDDAFYVAVSTVAEQSDVMYLKNPYSVGFGGLDYRRVMAPFPIWISFLARVSGLRTVFVAHVAVSAMMILMANMILFLIGGRIFKDGRKYLFAVFAEILILFGDYSMYTAEKFLIARSRQGKAALGSAVIPMIILIFLLISEHMKNLKKVPVRLWVLLFAVQMTGLLCSTQGVMLCCILVAILGVCLAFSYKKWSVLIPFAASCIPAAAVFLIYYLKTR